jgi:hypothetical protein
MRQMNAQSTPAVVPDIPAVVQPGEEIDHDVLIVGFEPVHEAPAPPIKKKAAARTPVTEAPTDQAGAPADNVKE